MYVLFLPGPWLIPQPVKHMPDGQQGVIPDHAGPGIAHDLADLFPYILLITMDRTVVAGCLIFLERAVFKP